MVRHQRDQRRNHHRQALEEQRGKLEAEALASTGRHDANHVVAAQHVVDGLALMRAEAFEPENPLQEVVEVGDRIQTYTLSQTVEREARKLCRSRQLLPLLPRSGERPSLGQELRFTPSCYTEYQ